MPDFWGGVQGGVDLGPYYKHDDTPTSVAGARYPTEEQAQASGLPLSVFTAQPLQPAAPQVIETGAQAPAPKPSPVLHLPDGSIRYELGDGSYAIVRGSETIMYDATGKRIDTSEADAKNKAAADAAKVARSVTDMTKDEANNLGIGGSSGYQPPTGVNTAAPGANVPQNVTNALYTAVPGAGNAVPAGPVPQNVMDAFATTVNTASTPGHSTDHHAGAPVPTAEGGGGGGKYRERDQVHPVVTPIPPNPPVLPLVPPPPPVPTERKHMYSDVNPLHVR